MNRSTVKTAIAGRAMTERESAFVSEVMAAKEALESIGWNRHKVGLKPMRAMKPAEARYLARHAMTRLDVALRKFITR